MVVVLFLPDRGVRSTSLYCFFSPSTEIRCCAVRCAAVRNGTHSILWLGVCLHPTRWPSGSRLGVVRRGATRYSKVSTYVFQSRSQCLETIEGACTIFLCLARESHAGLALYLMPQGRLRSEIRPSPPEVMAPSKMSDRSGASSQTIWRQCIVVRVYLDR